MTDREHAKGIFPQGDVMEFRRRFDAIIKELNDQGHSVYVECSADAPFGLIEMAEEAGVREEVEHEVIRNDLNDKHLSLDPDIDAKVLDVFARWIAKTMPKTPSQ